MADSIKVFDPITNTIRCLDPIEFTDNFGLTLLPQGFQDWSTKTNENWEAVDQLIKDNKDGIDLLESTTVKLSLDVCDKIGELENEIENIALTPGPTGIQGSTGEQGDTGLIGPTGAFGGPAGATGVQGVTGAQGQTGVQGVTGLGAQGETGVQGVTGVQGATGVEGQTGIQGITGLGIEGATGVQGNTGIQGITGVGTEGATGVEGQTGPSGGPIGETGIQGVTGLSGIGVLPAVQVRESTTGITGNLFFVDIDFDTTDVETDSTILEHDGIDTDRVTIKEDGLYQIEYHFDTSFFPTASARVRSNDASVLPGSGSISSFEQTCSATFLAELSSSDFITLQASKELPIGATGPLSPTLDRVTLSIVSQEGALGPTGLRGTTGPAAGPQGVTGLIGETGIQGVTGTGVQGATGIQGLIGETGIQGVTGAGVQGTTGVLGQTGFQGQTGIPGDVVFDTRGAGATLIVAPGDSEELNIAGGVPNLYHAIRAISSPTPSVSSFRLEFFEDDTFAGDIAAGSIVSPGITGVLRTFSLVDEDATNEIHMKITNDDAGVTGIWVTDFVGFGTG